MNGPNSGDYRQRVTLQRPSQTGRDTYGKPLVSWISVATLWAKVTPGAGSEAPNADRLKAVSSVVVETRWTGASLPVPGPTWRIIYGSRTFQVENVNNVGERGIVLQFSCKEVGNPPQ